jgi:hypothetical protein
MERASEPLSRRKLLNGAQTKGIIAVHSFASRFCFCREWKRIDPSQSLHRDPLKTKAEEVEPAPDADGGYRKVSNHVAADPICAGTP